MKGLIMERVPIEFEGYRINSIDYSVYEEGLSEDKDKGKLQVKSLLTEDRKNAQLIIKTTLNDENNNRKLIIELSGFFTVHDIELAEEFLSVNGVAILFPYVRSVVSIITSLDNENAVVLPTINFTKPSSE